MKSGLFVFDQNPGVVPPGSITNSELADMAALTVKGNATNASASPQDIAAAANGQYFGRAGNALLFKVIPGSDVSNTPAGGIAATTVQAAIDELDSEKLNIAGHTALSVPARAVNSSGALADVAATTARRLFGRNNSNVLDFVQIDSSDYIASNTIIAANLSATATDILFGRSTSGAGAGEQITCTSAGRALIDDADAAAQRVTLSVPYPQSYNFCRNSNFDVWQRGTSFTSGAIQYTADGWAARRANSTGGVTFSRQAGFNGSTYCFRLQRDSGNTSGQNILACQVFPPEVVAFWAGKTIRVSYLRRAGANYSGGNFTSVMFTGTAAGETFDMVSGFPTGSVNNGLNASSPPTTAAQASATLAVPSNALEAALRFSYTPSGTAGAADYVELDQVIVEVVESSSNPATNYIEQPVSRQLVDLQPYYQKSFQNATAPAQNVGTNTGEEQRPAPAAGAATERLGKVPFRNRMRATPTVTIYNPAASNAQVRDETAVADCSATTVANASETGFSISCTGNASTAVGGLLGFHWAADAELAVT